MEGFTQRSQAGWRPTPIITSSTCSRSATAAMRSVGVPTSATARNGMLRNDSASIAFAIAARLRSARTPSRAARLVKRATWRWKRGCTFITRTSSGTPERTSASRYSIGARAAAEASTGTRIFILQYLLCLAIAQPRRGEHAAGDADEQQRFHARPLVEPRSEEHTSELQSLTYLVCRHLLEKKK